MPPSGRPGRRGGGRLPAFTLLELLIALVILGALAALGSGLRAWGRPTAEQEALRAMRWLYGVLLRADRTGEPFSLNVEREARGTLPVTWGRSGATERLDAGEGCTFRRRSSEGTGNIRYSPQWGTFTPALTLEVRDAWDGVHYLILSGQGRVRTSAEPPPD